MHVIQLIWVKSQRCSCLVTWFFYQMIAKPGDKKAAPSWPDPYQDDVMIYFTNCISQDLCTWSMLCWVLIYFVELFSKSFAAPSLNMWLIMTSCPCQINERDNLQNFSLCCHCSANGIWICLTCYSSQQSGQLWHRNQYWGHPSYSLWLNKYHKGIIIKDVLLCIKTNLTDLNKSKISIPLPSKTVKTCCIYVYFIRVYSFN